MFKRGQRGRSKQRRLDRVATMIESVEWPRFPSHTLEPLLIDWATMPPSCDPGADFTALKFRPGTLGGKDEDKAVRMKGNRGLRKRQQVESLLRFLGPLVNMLWRANQGKKKVHIVDMASGTGNASLALAHVLKESATFTLVELRQVASDIASERIREAGLDAQSVARRIEDYMPSESVDVVLATHACGALSDIALARSAEWKAFFIICPCCVGICTTTNKKNLSERTFQSQLVASRFTEKHYKDLARIGDWGGYDFESEACHVRRQAKLFLEQDRLQKMRECGYSYLGLSKLAPLDASPKNDILFGSFGPNPPPEWVAGLLKGEN